MSKLKTALELVEATFKMNPDGTLEKLPEKGSKGSFSIPPPSSSSKGDKKSWKDLFGGSSKPPKGKPSKSPDGPTGVGPTGSEGSKADKYKAPEKWISAGGVVLGSKDDLDHVYVRKPSNNFGPWAFAKGKIDRGESQEQAAKREVREEIGIVAEFFPNSYLMKAEGGHSFTHYHLMYAVRNLGRHDKETEKVKLVTFNEAMHLFAKGGNTRDIKVLAAAMARIEQMRRAELAKQTDTREPSKDSRDRKKGR